MNILSFLKSSLGLPITEAKKKQEMTVDDTESFLDNFAKNTETAEKEIVKLIKKNGPMIYAFTTPSVKNAVKVGYTDQLVDRRIDQWRRKYKQVDELGAWPCDEWILDGENNEHVFFWDHAVHKKLADKNYKQIKPEEFIKYVSEDEEKPMEVHVSREFFDKYVGLNNHELAELSADILADLIDEMKREIREKGANCGFQLYKFKNEKTTAEKIYDNWSSAKNYSNTDLQKDAIKAGVTAIKAKKKNLLLAAVMRFGKTHAAYEIVKESGCKLVLVASAKADVRDAWRNDINHVDFINDFVFVEFHGQDKCLISGAHLEIDGVSPQDNIIHTTERPLFNDNGEDQISILHNQGKTVIVFATLQDLSGSIEMLKKKHKSIVSQEFDLLIIDETHYGSHAARYSLPTAVGKGNQKISFNDEEDYTEDAEKEQKEVDELKSKININHKCTLQVSGTPYYILQSGEMDAIDAEIISKVTYTDMLEARDKWVDEHPDADPTDNPYYGVPKLHKVGLKLTEKCRDVMKGANMTDSMNVLFEIKDGKFKHEDAIVELMKSIFGDDSTDKLGFLNNKTIEGEGACKHTLLVMPQDEMCHMMKQLLLDHHIINEDKREIIVCVSSGSHKADRVGESLKALNAELEELDKNNKKSLLLTVTRYLTGASIPFLDSMLYMKTAKRPESYDQAVFRLCTRNVRKAYNLDDTVAKKNGKNLEVTVKQNVYLIDFNIANMIELAKKSAEAQAAADGDRSLEHIRELVKKQTNAIPIYMEQRTGEILGKMHQMNFDDVLRTITEYNANKDYSQVVDDTLGNTFEHLYKDTKFQSRISKLNITGDKGKIQSGYKENPGNDEMNDNDFDDGAAQGDNGSEQQQKKNSLAQYAKRELSGPEKTLVKQTRELFQALIKKILYCNICLEEPALSFGEFVKKLDNDNMKQMFNDFELWGNKDVIKDIYHHISEEGKQMLDMLIYNIALASTETNDEKTMKDITSLGRMGKSEVITPDVLVEKMCNKLSKEDFVKANSILIVNSKCAEFFKYIKKTYGDDVAKKCRIVPSSGKTIYILKMLLKKMGMSDYINKILLDIPDTNGNSQYDLEDFLKMSNEKIKEYNMGKKFDICLMNPPYDNAGAGLATQFVKKCNEISNKNIVVYPATNLISTFKQSIELFNKHTLKSVFIHNAYDYFKITPVWKNIGIFEFINTETFETFDAEYNNKHTNVDNTSVARKEYYKSIDVDENFVKIINKFSDLRNKLFEKYKTMVNDGHGFIYEENDLNRGMIKYHIDKSKKRVNQEDYNLNHVKHYLKSGEYKYCLYKGSGNHIYDEVQEWAGQDVDKLFNGQICWLMNKENVKNNIKYWLECPLTDLWRRYYAEGRNLRMASGCLYGVIPALDFDQSEDKFREYVNSLNKFTKEEIETLKKFNVHNADKLKYE